MNPRSFFVPCCNHSLNLVVNDAVKGNNSSWQFFSTVQELYNFFSASTNRWTVLKEHISNLTLKPLSETRWSSRIDAITPLRYQLGEVYDALYSIFSGVSFDNNTKHMAESLANKLKSYRFICTLVLWYNVLFRVNTVSKTLQTKDFNISEACTQMNNLLKFFNSYRSDKGFGDVLVDASELAKSLDVEPTLKTNNVFRPRRVKKQFNYENDDEPITDGERDFKINIFFSTLDIVIRSIGERFDLLSSHSDHFQFLWDICKFSDLPEKEQLNCCLQLEGVLTDKNRNERDINGTELFHELQFLKNLNLQTPTQMLNYIIKNNLTHSVPNASVALRILLTMPVSVASAERTFSKLKLIKNYLRSSMGQQRLDNLAIISIESDLLDNINMTELISEFSRKKARKATFI